MTDGTGDTSSNLEDQTSFGSLREGYDRWVVDYRAYVRMRGFNSELNDWPFVRRSFIACWAEPGFHRFWRVWNPGISYFVYRIFVRLGGRKRRDRATVAAFLINGFLHNFVAFPFLWRWSWVLPIAFLFFGVITVLNRKAEPWLRQDRWPWLVNAVLNVGLVITGFDLGFLLDRVLCFG